MVSAQFLTNLKKHVNTTILTHLWYSTLKLRRITVYALYCYGNTYLVCLPVWTNTLFVKILQTIVCIYNNIHACKCTRTLPHVSMFTTIIGNNYNYVKAIHNYRCM